MAKVFDLVPLPIIYSIDFCQTKLGHKFNLPELEEHTYFKYESACIRCGIKLTISRDKVFSPGGIVLGTTSIGIGKGKDYPSFWVSGGYKHFLYCEKFKSMI